MKVSRIPPHFIRHVQQSGSHGDCGIACLATLMGLTYEEVLVAAARVKPGVLKQGLFWPEFQKVGRRLGVKLKVVKPPLDTLDEATGILGLRRLNPNHEARSLTEEHVVYLWAGRVLDGNGEGWMDVEDYLRQYHYEITGLLVIDE